MRTFTGKRILNFSIFLAFIVAPNFVVAQKSEIGLGIGGFSYTGDLSQGYQLLENRPAGELYYRYNLSKAVSLRASITGGKLQGSDASTPIDNFATIRNASFNIILIEPSATLEYNFLDFQDKNSFIGFSPYFFIGAGFFTFFGQGPSTAEYSNFQPTIPFGVGVKQTLSRHLRLNIEFGARKTFFDYLDNVSGSEIPTKNYQHGNPNSKDAYYFVGISLSYAFYPIVCPYEYN